MIIGRKKRGSMLESAFILQIAQMGYSTNSILEKRVFEFTNGEGRGKNDVKIHKRIKKVLG